MDKPWLRSYPDTIVDDIEFIPDSVVDYFEKTCAKYPNRNAVICHDEALTFKEIKSYVDKLAHALIKIGIEPGDHVAIMLPNSMQYVIMLFAILKVGAVVININPLYTPDEIEYIVDDAKIKLVVILDIISYKLDSICKKNPQLQVIITSIYDLYPLIKRIGIFLMLKFKRMSTSHNYKAHYFKDLLNLQGDIKFPNVKHSDLAFIQYTGATTGKPKGAMLLHGNIVANIHQIHAWLTPQIDGLDKQIVICVLPLYHIFALTANLLTFFFAGSLNIMIPNPKDINDVVHVLRKYDFTVLNALDTLYDHLLRSEYFKSGRYKYFKYSVAGGMPLREDVVNEWYKFTGVIPNNCYGLTETSPAVSMNIFNHTFDGSVGFPIPSTVVEIRDLEDSTRVLPPNTTGIIFVRGPQVMAGYWNQPEQSRLALQGGCFKTDDIGYIDEKSGKLFIQGRQSDMIIVSGFNVYPAELEDVISKLDGIAEVSVLGIPSALTGEEVVACVVVNNSKLTKDAIINYCHTKLARYKTPHRIEIMNSLPKTLIGKADKLSLKKYLLSKS